jgi:hypothetical protein
MGWRWPAWSRSPPAPLSGGDARNFSIKLAHSFVLGAFQMNGGEPT